MPGRRRKWGSGPDARLEREFGGTSDSVCWDLSGGFACMAPAVATYALKAKPESSISICEKHRKRYDDSADFARTAQFKPKEGAR